MCTYYKVYNTRIMTVRILFIVTTLTSNCIAGIVLSANIFTTPQMATSKRIDLDLYTTFCT